MPSYTIDDTFDVTSPYYNGALQLATPSGAQNIFTGGVSPATLTAGEIQGNTTVTDGYIQSDNYVAGVSGWQLLPASGEINFTLSVQQIVLGTSGYVRGGQTAYNTGTGFFLGYEGAAYKFSIGVGGSSSNSLTWDGTNLTINGYVQTRVGAFGGDGSDGALTISSGTTTIDLAGAAVVTKNYTSISITGTGALAFSNPNAAGTVITLKSQGNVTLTSSATPMVDCRNTGSAGGTAIASNTGENHDGTNGTAATQLWLFKGGPGGKGAGNSAGAAGTSGATPTFAAVTTASTFKYPNMFLGVGGGSGASLNQAANGTATAGVGGNGGGALIIECGGALNFTTVGGISVSGSAGGNGAIVTAATALAQGGGGGSAGSCIILYATLTASTGTITSAGGAGGSGAQTGSPSVPEGSGGGAGSPLGAGTAGSNGTSSQTGGTGSTGYSLVASYI